MLFDTHAHYNDERYNEDRDEILKKANESGVSYILNASCSINSSAESVALADKFEFVYAAVGIHPHSTKEAQQSDIDKLMSFRSNKKVVAIGEIGLDYYHQFSPKETQKRWLINQIELAKNLNLPIIIHNRDSHGDMLKLIKEENAKSVGGVFHCYSGSVEMAKELLDNNFYISMAGPVTFKNVRKALEVVKYLPEDRILIETDCPYLTPEPHRGKRNDSSYVKFVAEKIAEVRKTTFEHIANITRENGKRLFRIT